MTRAAATHAVMPHLPPSARPSAARLAVAALLASLAGCAGADAPPAADAAPDTAAADAAPGDARELDPPRAPRAPRVPDVPRAATGACAAGALIDLDARGVRTGDTTRYVGSNAAAPADSPFVSPCAGRPTSVVAFRYTVRTHARLIVSTFHADTGADFDTVVWAQRACAPGAPSLGCNDDVGPPFASRGSPAASRFHSFFSTDTGEGPELDAGATVYLFVGTFAPALGTPSTGTFQLSVTETAPRRVGGACDPTGSRDDDPRGAGCTGAAACRPASDDLSDFRCAAPLALDEPCDPRGVRNVCDEGAWCQTTGSLSRCARRGVVGARCNTTEPRCEVGAVCGAGDTCLREVAVGARCGASDGPVACARGAVCTNVSGAYQCVARGALWAPCDGTSERCDEGLACSGYVCVTALPLGATCEPWSSRSVCADGYCPRDVAAPRCTPRGGRDAPCRSTSPSCDAGHRCNGDTCVPEVAVGGACDASGSRRPASYCVEGTVCQTEMGVARCVLAGVAGAPCRSASAPCDAGLACGSGGRCVPAVARGERCDPRGVTDRCPAGTTCLSAGAEARCLDDGADGRPCRYGGPPCDEGLLCSGSRCRPRVEVGGACDLAGLTGACVPSSTCRAAAPGAAPRCVADGALGGRCELSSWCPGTSTCGRCRDGLDCGAEFTCVPEVQVGERCDPRRLSDGCGAGASCVTTRGEGRCVRDGALGGACARGAVACGPGLRCDASQRCMAGIVHGAKCDPTGALGVCAVGSACRHGSSAWRCIPDGALGGAPRAWSPSCDSRLVDGGGRCVEGLGVGAPCAEGSACAVGSSCASVGGVSRCVTDGRLAGRCRTGATCDPGLGCNARWVCVVGVRLGEACNPSSAADACEEGATCVRGTDGARCVARGVRGGGCRPGPSSCDAGLACSAQGVCVEAQALGAPCAEDSQERACPAGSACLSADAGTRCLATGALGGFCRSARALCDEGYACGADFRCRVAVALGEVCDAEGRRNTCAAGTSCRPVAAEHRCVAHGVVGAACRSGEPRCDPGLSCAPETSPSATARRCVVGIAVGAACDPARPQTSRCVDGAVCRAVGAGGVCAPAGYGRAPSTERMLDACALPGAATLTMGPSLSSLPAALPFAFPYFGVEHPAGAPLTVGTQGWLRFGATALRDASPDELPAPFPDDAVFPLWTRAQFGVGGPSLGRVCLATEGAAPSRVFVVTWHGLHAWDEAAFPFSTELQMREGTGTLDVLYRLPEMGVSDPALGATVGLQGPGATSWVQVCGGVGPTSTPCARAHLRDVRFLP